MLFKLVVLPTLLCRVMNHLQQEDLKGDLRSYTSRER